MLHCNECIINPICQIGCEELLGDLNKITLEDFTKTTKLPKRLISLPNENIHLKLYNNIEVKIDCGLRCNFVRDGEFHREGGPAIEYNDGEKYWYINGKLHREDGPAIEHVNGYKCWYINEKQHREDGPAVIYANGNKSWFKNGELHREGGPAIEHVNGYKEWHKNGELHREGGPAIEHIDGNKSWYINGKFQKKEIGNKNAKI